MTVKTNDDFETKCYDLIRKFVENSMSLLEKANMKAETTFASYFDEQAGKLLNHIETLNNDIARQVKNYSSQDKFPEQLNRSINETLNRIKYSEINAEYYKNLANKP